MNKFDKKLTCFVRYIKKIKEKEAIFCFSYYFEYMII